MQTNIHWPLLEDVYWSLKAQYTKTLFLTVFLSVGIAVLSGLSHMQKMVLAHSEALFAGQAMLQVDLYPITKNPKPFDLPTLERLQVALLPTVEVRAYQALGLSVQVEGYAVEAQVIAVEPQVLHWLGLVPESGRLLSSLDEGQKLAVVGSAVPIASVLTLNQTIGVSVIGTLVPVRPSLLFDYDINRVLFVPLHTAPRLGVRVEPVSLLIRSTTGDVAAAKQLFETVLPSYTAYGAFIRNPSDFGPYHQQAQLLKKASRGFSILLSGVAIGFLWYLMQQLVVQKRHELGVRMALGATPAQVAVWVGMHFGLVASVAAIGGLILAAVGVIATAAITHWPLVWTLQGTAVALLPLGICMVLALLQWRKLATSMPVQWLL